MPPPCAGGGVVLAATIGALYTGRGPVCGITTRRGATTGRAGAAAASGADGAAGDSVDSPAGTAGVSFPFAAISGCTIGASTTGADGAVTGATASGFS